MTICPSDPTATKDGKIIDFTRAAGTQTPCPRVAVGTIAPGYRPAKLRPRSGRRITEGGFDRDHLSSTWDGQRHDYPGARRVHAGAGPAPRAGGCQRFLRPGRIDRATTLGVALGALRGTRAGGQSHGPALPGSQPLAGGARPDDVLGTAGARDSFHLLVPPPARGRGQRRGDPGVYSRCRGRKRGLHLAADSPV